MVPLHSNNSKTCFKVKVNVRGGHQNASRSKRWSPTNKKYIAKINFFQFQFHGSSKLGFRWKTSYVGYGCAKILNQINLFYVIELQYMLCFLYYLVGILFLFRKYKNLCIQNINVFFWYRTRDNNNSLFLVNVAAR